MSIIKNNKDKTLGGFSINKIKKILGCFSIDKIKKLVKEKDLNYILNKLCYLIRLIVLYNFYSLFINTNIFKVIFLYIFNDKKIL